MIFKAVQTKFINYARKQIERSEMNEEIRLRTPSRRRSPIGSVHGLGVIVKRPSVGNILAQVPYLQQHLSEANLVTVCCISLKFSNKNTFNLGKEKYIRKSTKTVFFQSCTTFQQHWTEDNLVIVFARFSISQVLELSNFTNRKV